MHGSQIWTQVRYIALSIVAGMVVTCMVIVVHDVAAMVANFVFGVHWDKPSQAVAQLLWFYLSAAAYIIVLLFEFLRELKEQPEFDEVPE